MRLSIRSSYPSVCDAIHECAYTGRQKERKKVSFSFASSCSSGRWWWCDFKTPISNNNVVHIHPSTAAMHNANKQANKQQCAQLFSIFLLSWNLGRGSMATARRDSCLWSHWNVFFFFFTAHILPPPVVVVRRVNQVQKESRLDDYLSLHFLLPFFLYFCNATGRCVF